MVVSLSTVELRYKSGTTKETCMTNLINTPKTMSSREIAELTGKRHDNVMRTINKCGDLLTPQFEDTPNPQNGQIYKVAQLNKRDSLVLVARLSPEFTAAIVDRWQELEKASQPQVPQTYAAALLEAGRLALENEQLQLEARENAPKVEFFEQVTGSKDTVDVGQAAKVLNIGIGRNKLFELLRDKKVLQNNNQPYQKYIDCGYFRVIESKFTKPNGDTSINLKTVVYQKGLNYIRKLINKEGK